MEPHSFRTRHENQRLAIGLESAIPNPVNTFKLTIRTLEQRNCKGVLEIKLKLPVVPIVQKVCHLLAVVFQCINIRISYGNAWITRREVGGGEPMIIAIIHL